jgi:hypothetical protein
MCHRGQLQLGEMLRRGNICSIHLCILSETSQYTALTRFTSVSASCFSTADGSTRDCRLRGSKCSFLSHRTLAPKTAAAGMWRLTFLLVKWGQHRSVTTHFEVDVLLGANREGSWWDNYSHACIWTAQCPPLVGKHPPGRGHHLLTVTPLTNFSSTPMVM